MFFLIVEKYNEEKKIEKSVNIIIKKNVILSVQEALIFDSVYHVSSISSRLKRMTDSQVDCFVFT